MDFLHFLQGNAMLFLIHFMDSFLSTNKIWIPSQFLTFWILKFILKHFISIRTLLHQHSKVMPSICIYFFHFSYSSMIILFCSSLLLSSVYTCLKLISQIICWLPFHSSSKVIQVSPFYQCCNRNLSLDFQYISVFSLLLKVDYHS